MGIKPDFNPAEIGLLNSDRALLEEESIPKVEVKVQEDILYMVDSDEDVNK